MDQTMDVSLLPFTVRGTVVVGFRKARAVGFPTANIALEQPIDIAEGTYLGWATTKNSKKRIPALVFYGKPLSIPEVHEARIEAHLLGEANDIYGQTIELELVTFIRPNEKFATDALLTQAIHNDFKKAEFFFVNRET